jgi:glycine dehydrogenase subunit 2
MHEFVMSLEKFHKEDHVSALDVAKALLDYGIHPPTMYFPLIVDEALMVEPTETEAKEVLDNAIDAFIAIYKKMIESPVSVTASPVTTPVRRLDEVHAARDPKLKYTFE